MIANHTDGCNGARSSDTKFKEGDWWLAGRGTQFNVGRELRHYNSKGPGTGVDRAEDDSRPVRDAPWIIGSLRL